jgi:hypothetical protein
MTYVDRRAARLMALLLTMIALALTSYAATAQQKKPALQKEPEKVETQEPTVPDQPEKLRRTAESLEGVPDWVPQAGKLREVDCSGTETVQFLPIDVYPVLPVKDDTELDGKPRLKIDAEVSHSAGRIFLTGSVTIWEGHQQGMLAANTNTTFKSSFAFDSIVLKKGCAIDSVSPAAGQIGDDGNDSHDWEKVYGAGLIESADCRQDTRGDDEGKVGCKSIRLKPIEITFRKVDETRICDAVQMRPRNGFIYPLYTTRGGPHGKDMGGNRVDVFLDSNVRISDTPDGEGQELQIVTDLRMTEIREKQGRAMRVNGEGGQRNVFLTAFDSPGCRIVDVRPATGTLRGKSFEGDHEPRQYGTSEGNLGKAAGLIDYAICRTDTSGDDSGKIGCTEVAYELLTIILEPYSP